MDIPLHCENLLFADAKKNKAADQLRSICAADQRLDQRLCFRYIDTTIPFIPKSEISGL